VTFETFRYLQQRNKALVQLSTATAKGLDVKEETASSKSLTT
jgi:hypothetical protein